MKSLRQSISLKSVTNTWFICLVFIWGISNPVLSQERLQENKLQVAFEEFHRIDAKQYYNSMQLDIANLLKIGLLKVDYLELVDLNIEENNRNVKEQLYQSDNRKVAGDPDIVIYGSYAIYEKTYSIYASIFITSDKKTIDIAPITGELTSPYIQLEKLAQNIINEISNWRNQSPGLKKIAILCKTKNARRENKLNLDYYKNMTIQITEGIGKHAHIMITPWDNAAQYYLNDMDNLEISKQLSVDGLLIANMEMLDNGITLINPTFFIANSNELIELGEIQSDYFHDLPLQDELIFRANRFFDHILKKDGSWNVELFMETASNFDGYFEIAHRYYENSMPSVSNYYYFKAQKYAPESPDLHYNMAINYALMERDKEAKQEYGRVLKIDRGYINAYYGIYLLYIHEANYNAALDISREAEAVEPENPFTLLMLGNSYYYTGNYKNAIEYLKRAIEKNPEDPSLYASLGFSQYSLNKTEDAMNSFQKALTLDENNQNYGFYVAEMMIKKGSNLLLEDKYDEALGYLLDSKKYYDLDYAADYIRQCYLLTGHLDKAINIFDEYLSRGYYSEINDYYKLASDIRYAFLKKDNVSYLSPEYGQAVLDYTNKHLSFSPDDSFALWLIGNTYTFLESYEKGMEYLEKAYYVDKTNMDFALDLTESLLLNLKYERSDGIIKEILLDKKLLNTISENDKMLLKLLHVGNVAALNDRIDKNDAKDIYQYLEDGKKFRDWSYDAFVVWINDHLSENTKSDLLTLVAEMEKNTL